MLVLDTVDTRDSARRHNERMRKCGVYWAGKLTRQHMAPTSSRPDLIRGAPMQQLGGSVASSPETYLHKTTAFCQHCKPNHTGLSICPKHPMQSSTTTVVSRCCNEA